MMDELVTDLALAVEDRHLQRIEGQVGAQVVSDLPSDDLAGDRSVTNAAYANPQAVPA